MTSKRTDTHRTIILTLRLNPEEHKSVLAVAAQAALPPSTFARHALLGTQVTTKTYISLAPEDIGQLKRLGNLLNQIARAGWRGRFTQPTEELLASVLMELKIALRKASRTSLAP